MHIYICSVSVYQISNSKPFIQKPSHFKKINNVGFLQKLRVDDIYKKIQTVVWWDIINPLVQLAMSQHAIEKVLKETNLLGMPPVWFMSGCCLI